MFFDVFAPEPDDGPAFEKKLFVDLVIPFPVAGNFTNPELAVIAFLQFRAQNFPVFSVKKLSIAENGDFISGKNDVRFPGKGPDIFR